MAIKTVFSAYITELQQLPTIFSRTNGWSSKQDHSCWEKHGSYLSFSENELITFNFLVINAEGLSKIQKEEVIQIFQSSGLVKTTTLIAPHPAS